MGKAASGPRGVSTAPGFICHQRIAQTEYLSRRLEDGTAGQGGSLYRLFPQYKAHNLAPYIRDNAKAYFKKYNIAWHTHANHALSSQVSCLNFLMPLATRPDLLGKLVGTALCMPPPTIEEVEKGPDGQPWYVGFEWIGKRDYLTEAGKSGVRKRGAHATSADAVVRFKHAGHIETVLIEWKYTERYGAPLPPAGNDTRRRRYKDLVLAPDGPVRADLGLKLDDFFWEPFYQLLRQQMLAFQMQAAREDGAERVRVLHISPSANRALHKVTAPRLHGRGDDVFEVFRGLLVRPDDFITCSTEAVFGAALAEADKEAHAWAEYLLDRYTFLGRRINNC